ncbi:Tetratricopeptide repeat (TPR)-like superfamily protein [Striga hermonthica]|uniref:Tetratricopeptide repeat (TPR)-like superfamily protein n=1 Tax=Striga hermonthica TaxID=68872 RepID=A0A9N7NL61_STRHE|nr:Tetratricopeptide repeat (TPR)-like superfamily protein [Striga hermonthica]
MHQVDELLSEMKEKGFLPNGTTFDILVCGHVKTGNKKESIRLYCEMITRGFVPHISTYNLLISNFAKVGKMKQAMELLNEVHGRRVMANSSTYDILISGWCNLSYQEKSVKNFCQAEASRSKEAKRTVAKDRVVDHIDQEVGDSFGSFLHEEHEGDWQVMGSPPE